MTGTNFGLAPLQISALVGLKDTVRILLERGAEPNMREINGRTSLTIALMNGHTETADILRENGGTE